LARPCPDFLFSMLCCLISIPKVAALHITTLLMQHISPQQKTLN